MSRSMLPPLFVLRKYSPGFWHRLILYDPTEPQQRIRSAIQVVSSRAPSTQPASLTSQTHNQPARPAQLFSSYHTFLHVPSTSQPSCIMLLQLCDCSEQRTERRHMMLSASLPPSLLPSPWEFSMRRYSSLERPPGNTTNFDHR